MRLPASWENLSRYCVSIVRRTSCNERYKLNFSIFSVGEEFASPKVVDAGEHAFIYNTHKWQNVDRVGFSGENGTEKKDKFILKMCARPVLFFIMVYMHLYKLFLERKSYT